MSNARKRVSWYPLDGRAWDSRHWLGSDTWIDRHRIFSRVSPPRDDSCPPLLMLHGVVVSGHYFAPVARCLDVSQGMFVPDLPGFGRSIADGVPTLSEHVDVLDRWMDVHHLRQVVVVANSNGCQVATLLATRYPDRVSRLVLVAPTFDPSTRGLPGIIFRGLRDIPREDQRLWTIWLPDLFASGPVRAIRTLLDSMRDPQLDRLGQVRQPAICVAGARDPICPPEWVRQYASHFASGRSLVLDGAPHALNYSAPDALAYVIASVMDNEAALASGAARMMWDSP